MAERRSERLDWIAAAAAKHERLIAIVAGAWFVVSSASYAGFVDLPEIPFITDRVAIFVASGANAVWWGFLRPAVERRKRALVNTGVGGSVR